MDIELRNDRIPRNPFDRQFLDMTMRAHVIIHRSLRKNPGDWNCGLQARYYHMSEVLPELYYPKFVGTSESSFEDIYIDIAIVTHVIALKKKIKKKSYRNFGGASAPPSSPLSTALCINGVVHGCALHVD